MAYIDPNTGGLLFQALAAAFALLSGVALLFSRQIRAAFARFRRFIRERFGGGQGTEPTAAAADRPGDER